MSNGALTSVTPGETRRASIETSPNAAFLGEKRSRARRRRVSKQTPVGRRRLGLSGLGVASETVNGGDFKTFSELAHSEARARIRRGRV